MISIFNLVGSITISFVFGWKLSLVGILAIMPVVLSAGYLRVSLERGFEKLNSAGKSSNCLKDLLLKEILQVATL